MVTLVRTLMDCPDVSYLQAPLQLPQIQEPEKLWQEWLDKGTRIKIHLEAQDWAPFERWKATEWKWNLLGDLMGVVVENVSVKGGVINVTGRLSEGLPAGQLFGAVAGILERTVYAQEIGRIRIEAS